MPKKPDGTALRMIASRLISGETARAAEEVAGDRVAIQRCGVGFPAIALVHDPDQFPALRAVRVEQAGPFEILGEGLVGYFAEELVNDYLVLPLGHRSSS